MLTINNKLSNSEEIIHHIADGILAIHRKNSGTIYMLENYLQSYKNEVQNNSKIDELKFYSITEEHPVFDELINIYRIQNLAAIMVIKNGAVESIMHSPISKSDLIKQLNNVYSQNSI